MVFGQLLFTIPPEKRLIIRNYEKLNKKLIKNKWSKQFNETCLKENILPTYSNLVLYI